MVNLLRSGRFFFSDKGKGWGRKLYEKAFPPRKTRNQRPSLTGKCLPFLEEKGKACREKKMDQQAYPLQKRGNAHKQKPSVFVEKKKTDLLRRGLEGGNVFNAQNRSWSMGGPRLSPRRVLVQQGGGKTAFSLSEKGGRYNKTKNTLKDSAHCRGKSVSRSIISG